MDTQPTPPNSPGAGERPSGMSAEQLPAAAEPTPRAESAPTPGSAPPPAQPAASATPPPAKLSGDDVAAVIASVPGPNGPAGAVPTPTIAGDVDVIEPEWVDRAEQTVREHQGDPYEEEEAVEDLQQDYLKKRYGYNVSDPNSDSNKPEGA
jgi:hypothetical protein